MLDDLGGRDGPEAERLFQAVSACMAEQEAGGEQVASPGGVDQFFDALGRNVGPLVTTGSKRAFFAARNDQYFDLVPHRGDRGLEMRHAGQRLDLRLIGEKDVDPAGVEQLVETVSMAVDAEGVRKREGDFASGLTRDLDCPHHRVARRLWVPQIAFEIEDGAVADLRLVERIRR